VSGIFKISYGKLGPTEIRAIAVILNMIMYFGGAQMYSLTISGNSITYSPYDLMVLGIALLLLIFFVVTAVQETIRLARENR
jgi:archaetidylinositol phosphate synthase